MEQFEFTFGITHEMRTLLADAKIPEEIIARVEAIVEEAPEETPP